MKKILFILGLVICISCDNEDDENTDSTLIGEWKLIEVLVDPGDGSGTFQSVESNKVIEFKDDGTITSNGTICNMSVESDSSTSGTYSLTDSTIYSAGCLDHVIDIWFELDGSDLIIYYPCIEACGAKYRKQ